ncbi:hypothetical protein M2105_005851 [Paenibacillus sp. PastF-1]|nr:hypothetical protein [Paenibacillus sp. PastF-2]MDF9851370.1 hypothetical protein [Paenibacillus sp. PastM-2]MDF9857952.1 hypothetical protein [Paenibacillus sp. PastF-1]MDH6483220.1 hypothetical protein [Paenibacillus sp. PastH-2]MDH6510630.1 hypothetical protein [Paenibacillus sp. PastM-3]
MNDITHLTWIDIISCPQPQKFDNTGEDMEDLISIGTIGLIKVIGSYRPNKDVSLHYTEIVLRK